MKLIFERGNTGRGLDILPECHTPEIDPGPFARKKALHLPEVSESEMSRHYTELAKQTYGVNDGFYPLGSCTMKYNPKINDEIAGMLNFVNIHPLQAEKDSQGSLEVLYRAERSLCAITGMDAMTLQPAAGAHGEFTGLLLIKAYHESRGETRRTKIIVPDSAHGTNPASAAMAGFSVINIKSDERGLIDLGRLKEAVGDDTAGLMLTNPNTVGVFDPNIGEITRIVHEAGGLCYYDGANLNAIMGITRPGDMGFDVMHINLHKTFSTPHGGGGPGSGPVGCKAFLSEFLPGSRVTATENGFRFVRAEHTIGDMVTFLGNFLVIVRALTYIMTLGRDGIPEASRNAVLNANYMMAKLKPYYQMAYDHPWMHEFVMDLSDIKHETGISALDIAKGLLDHGIHPPTMYFPLIVHEALMIEPTETEDRETLDEAVQIFIDVLEEARKTPEEVHAFPARTPVHRLDEVGAARKPVTRYAWK